MGSRGGKGGAGARRAAGGAWSAPRAAGVLGLGIFILLLAPPVAAEGGSPLGVGLERPRLAQRLFFLPVSARARRKVAAGGADGGGSQDSKACMRDAEGQCDKVVRVLWCDGCEVHCYALKQPTVTQECKRSHPCAPFVRPRARTPRAGPRPHQLSADHQVLHR